MFLNNNASRNNFLFSIAENINEVLFRYQIMPEQKFDYLNNAILDMTGYPRAEFLSNPGFLEKIIAPDDRHKFKTILADTMDGSDVIRIICRDGVIRPFDFHYVHILSFKGEVLAVEGIIHRFSSEFLHIPSVASESVNDRVLYYADKLKTVSNISLTLAEKMSLQDIYTLLSSSIIELYPDVRMITIARYHRESNQLECVSAVLGNETMDVSEFPPLPLEPPGIGTQSEVIYTRKPFIVSDLVARLKKVSKVITVDSEGKEGGTAPQSSICIPMLSRGEVLGVVQLQSSLKNRYSQEDAGLLSVVANTAAVAIQNAALIENLAKSRDAIREGYDSTLAGLSRALEIRDQETEGHTTRVAELSLNFAKRLRLNEQEMTNLWRGALMHDIGKIGVPDTILKKEGPLTSDEWIVMRRHSEDGFRILMGVPFFKNSLDVLRYHHEKWDGTGYPTGMKGEEIPLHARMFALVDVWDALVSDRPYRKAWSNERALAYIRDSSGTHFDPYLANEFINLIVGEEMEGLNGE